MKRKLAYFFAALLLSGAAAFATACDPACSGLGNAFVHACLEGDANSDACQSIIKNLAKHDCPVP